MLKKCQKRNVRKNSKTNSNASAISYRLKCAKTANGLSHFVMYGDAPKEKSLL
jgi:hypothetical protein